MTVRELRAVAQDVDRMARACGILEGEEWTEETGCPAHLVGSSYRFPHLVLEEGSATYGRAWRLNATGGTRYRTGHSDPLHLGSGYLGSTKAEAMRCLRGLQAAFWAKMSATERGAWRADND